MGRNLSSEIGPLRPSFQSIVASRANEIVGSLIAGAVFVGVMFYQLHQRHFAQAAGSALLIGLIAYGLFGFIRDAFNGIEAPARRRIDGWAPPRSAAVIVLVSASVAATIVAWLVPNRWYIEQGSLGWSEVWRQHQWWRLATSPFLHANLPHLYFNMIALLLLGREIDSTLGTRRFITIYLAAALGGDLLVLATGQERTLGASGAIYGLMGAALYFGVRALKAGHRDAARPMLLT